VADSASCARALDGCQAALYLVRGIGEGGDYHRSEVMGAATFSKAAAAGVERIVYLDVAPIGTGSDHLRSRLDVGEALRAGSVKTIELRASMNRRARQPELAHRPRPGGPPAGDGPATVDEVAQAAGRDRRCRRGAGAGARAALEASAWFDIPGPVTLSGKAILEDSARVMGLRHPRMVAVPFLSPRPSSLWVRFVTRAEWSVAREVVVGLTEDLLARDDRFWALVGRPHRLSFAEAAKRALDAERGDRVQGTWGAIERARGLSKSSA
jgi:hypothetical protein